MKEEDLGASASRPGSREPSPSVPLGSAASGFDPSRDRLTALREAQARSSAVLLGLVPQGHRCGPIEATEEVFNALTAAHEAEEAAAAALMPTEQDAIRLMHDAYTRLGKLGWNNISHCPKDGSEFDVIEPGSTGIHRAHYSGEWPDGHWWIADHGDLWPSRPILYRVTEAEKARWEGLRESFRALRDSDGPRMAETNEDSARGEAGPARARRASPNPNSGQQP